LIPKSPSSCDSLIGLVSFPRVLNNWFIKELFIYLIGFILLFILF
jgi:hypothetical protein